MFRSKHGGWTWEGKRTPFGGGGKGGGMGPAGGQTPPNLNTPPNPPQAPARDIVQETMQQRQQAAAQAAQPTQVAPMPQQPAPASALVQQQQMQPQMGIGYQQPGLQSMLARILGYGGGNSYMPQQIMQRGMPMYSQYGMGQNPLGYRPDMARVQQNLSNVRPSIQKQNQDAQAARIADLEAQLARYNTPASSGGDSGGGG